MAYELQNLYQESEVVFLPKGRNRRPITEALQEANIDVPDFPGRQLTAKYDGKNWMLARDADMATCLERRPDGMGFIGTDNLGEMPEEERTGFAFLGITDIDGRFALLTTKEKIGTLESKLERAEPVQIATTYPQGARVAVGGLMLRIPGANLRVDTLDIDGSIEAAPSTFPEVDGIYDIVETGRTAEENGVLVVRDNLAGVTLGAIAKIEQATRAGIPLQGAELAAVEL
jgi:ATP phosphoribosyltransferase